MLYAMIARDKPNGLDHRLATRPEHLAHLESLGEAVVFAGALTGDDGKPNGSLVVLDAPDLEAARAMASSDPFVVKGVFEGFTLQQWNWTFKNSQGRGQ